MSVWQLSLLHLTVYKLPHFFVIVYNGVVSKTYLSVYLTCGTLLTSHFVFNLLSSTPTGSSGKHIPWLSHLEAPGVTHSTKSAHRRLWSSGQLVQRAEHQRFSSTPTNTFQCTVVFFVYSSRKNAGILLGLLNTGVEYNDHYSRETLYLSRQGLWLEKQTIDNTTQTIPLALITIEATCPRKRKCYTMTPLQSDSRELSIINQFGSPANGGDSEKKLKDVVGWG